MRPITVTVGPLVAASANNIALSQTPTTTFTLSGSTGGALDTPRRILFTQAASESGKTYTIIGTTWGGLPQTEPLAAAASATTVATALDFLTVTSIAISSAATGAITVGTNGVASSRWVRLDEWIGESAAVECVATGTVNYTIQETMQDPNSPTNVVLPYNVTWVSASDTVLVGATATTSSIVGVLPIYIRVLLNSGTGSVSTILSQASTGGGGGGSGGGSSSGGTTVKATAAAPTYVEGSTTNPVSSDLHGSQRSTLLDAGGNAIDFSAASPVTQSGTWTVQPGNTANTTAWKVDNSAVNQPVIGTTANDAALTTNPVAVGGLAKSTNPTIVTDGDAVYLRLDRSGRLVIVQQQPRDLMTRSAVVTLTSTTETTLTAAVAGTFLDMTSIKLCNTSATAVRCDVRDDTAGTVQDTWYIPAGQTVGMVYSTPLKQSAVNKNWTVQLSGAVTDVRITAQFAQNL